MATQFSPNLYSFGDDAGLGAWLDGHFRQHLAYVNFLATKTPPQLIPVYNIFTVTGGKAGRRFWLDAHEKWHEAVRPFANITGVDLSVVDMDDQLQFYEWLDLHNQEHAAIDAAFGLA